MALPIIPEFNPPHEHLAETSFLIAATITHSDGTVSIGTASIADTPEEVPTVLTDILFDLDEVGQDHLQLIAGITETMSMAVVWIENHLTGLPHKMHIMIDGDPEVYVQVFTIVKAERIKDEAA